MRKLFALLALVAVCIFSMASCDVVNSLLGKPEEEECEHTFSTEWATNATQHWHAATCEHGEIRDQLADHTDADEDGLCDVCAHEIGHEHTFAAEWTADDDKHWKEATCSHSDVKGEEALHSDNNTDGICDVCAGHVHILDGAGFCTGCDKEIMPPDENDFLSVAAATTARAFKVKSGKVEYVVVTRSRTEAAAGEEYSEYTAWDVFEYLFGTNGVYSKLTEDEYTHEGEGFDAVAVKTGNYAVTEHWIPMFEGENGGGIAAISSVNPDTLEGGYVNAYPATFGEGDLVGYFFVVPALANGNGADAFLYAIAEMSASENASDLVVTADPENNKIVFEFNVFVVNATHMSDDTMVYQVNYFEINGEFTYSDDYVITSLEVTIDSYTNEPGKGQTQSYEADIDLDYDPDTNVMTLRPTAVPHTYYYKVTQEIGEKEEIALKDMDYFTPDSFDLFADLNGTTPVTEIEALIGDRSLEFYILGEGGFAEFIYNQITVTVTDADGNKTGDLEAARIGGAIQLYTHRAGQFNVTVSAIGISRTVSVTIKEKVITGEFSFKVNVTDAYGWSNKYEFVPEQGRGKYIFYFPGTVGLSLDPEGAPIYDPQGVSLGNLEPYSYETTIRDVAQKFIFYFTATAAGEYTVYYDYIPA